MIISLVLIVVRFGVELQLVTHFSTKLCCSSKTWFSILKERIGEQLPLKTEQQLSASSDAFSLASF